MAKQELASFADPSLDVDVVLHVIALPSQKTDYVTPRLAA